MEKSKDIDLKIPDKLPDFHKIRNERKYNGSYITSDIEFCSRLHDISFSSFHAELLSPYLHDSIVADLGCGMLPYINNFPKIGIKKYYGLDLHSESLLCARKNYKGRFPLILIYNGVYDTPFEDNSIDIVISSEVLEHLEKPIVYLKEIHRICKKGGYLSLSTPCASMYFYPYNLIYMMIHPIVWYKKINAHKYWNKILDRHPGLQPAILRKWASEIGFSVIRHETKLWYYKTPIRLIYRICSFLERIDSRYISNIFNGYLNFTDKLLRSNLPLIKWCGIRQFILCKKD